MHPKNNKNGAERIDHASADALRSRDPHLARVAGNAGDSSDRCYSEAVHAVMDEMQGTASSRRAEIYNSLRH